MALKQLLRLFSLNNKQASLLAFFILNYLGLNAQIIQDLTIGGSDYDELRVVLHQDDVTTLFFNSVSPISGDKSISNHTSDYDVWIVQLDENNTIIKQRVLGGFDQDFIKQAIQLKDGSYIVGCNSSSPVDFDKTTPNYGYSDYWIVKLDSNLNIVWQKTYGSETNDDLSDITTDSQGNIYLTGDALAVSTLPSGNRTVPSKGLGDLWVLKLDANGDEIWQRSFGGDLGEYSSHISINSFQEIFIYTTSNSPTSLDKSIDTIGGNDGWLLKLDSNGNLVRDIVLGTTSNDSPTDVFNVGDKIYVSTTTPAEISGNKTSDFYGGGDCWLVQLDRDLNVNWQKTYGGSGDEIFSDFYYSQSKESLFMLITSSSFPSGVKTTPNKGGNDYWLLEIDSQGNILSQNGIGAINNDVAVSIAEKDNRLLLGGFSNSNVSGDKTNNSQGSFDGWLVELDVALSNKITEDNKKSFSVYPNPGSEELFLNGIDENEFYQLFDITGQQVLNGILNNSSISISDLQSGIYFLEIEGYQTQRIVKK